MAMRQEQYLPASNQLPAAGGRVFGRDIFVRGFVVAITVSPDDERGTVSMIVLPILDSSVSGQ